MKKDIKLVAIDIDGTLIDDNLKVSKNTVDIIKELRKRDIVVSLVTGRAYGATRKIIDQIEIELPIISHNGGKVTLEDGKVIRNKKFPISAVKKALEYGEKNNIYMKVYVDDLFYVTVENERTRRSYVNFGVDYEVIDNFIDDIIDDINLLIMFYDRDVDEEEFKKFEGLDVEVTTSMPHAIELIPKGISKAWGLKELKRYLNISKEEILAIGNSLNDLSMLEFAGTGIAMKNSDPFLLNNFDNISKYTNNEEGVYKILKAYL